jgi:hypothetical protein
MTEAEVVERLRNALAAIRSNEQADLQASFADGASFNLPQNPYRIDDLSAFKVANDAFFAAGGSVVGFSIRQPRVHLLDSGGVIAFHYAQLLSIDGANIASHGKGTAVLGSDGRIIHFHLTEHGPAASVGDGGGGDRFASVAPRLMKWGTDP